MQDLELKKKVLQEMMDLMDEKDGESLKSHPKMMALKVEAKPEVEEKESHLMADGSKMLDGEMSEDDEELSPEMVQKILEMYKQMQ